MQSDGNSEHRSWNENLLENNTKCPSLASQTVVFGIIGLASNIVLYLAYLLLTLAGVSVLLAMTLVFFTGVIFSWVLNARFTFKRSLTTASAKRMLITYSVAYSVNAFILGVAHFFLHLPHEVAQGAIMLVLAIALFFAQKYWVFGRA